MIYIFFLYPEVLSTILLVKLNFRFNTFIAFIDQEYAFKFPTALFSELLIARSECMIYV